MTPREDRPLVDLDGVTAGYGRRPRGGTAGSPGSPAAAIDGVTLRIDRHSFLGIVGPSGAGKTTVLRVLTGALAPWAGTVTRAPGLTVGYVPQVQSVDWTFPLTVTECVLLARTARSWRPRATAADGRTAADLLDRLGVGGLGDRHIRELSGGQQQRVFLARALAQDPQVVVLDEPTSGVDLRTRHEVLHVLADLHAAGLAIVLSTHDLNGVAAHLPAVACLNRTVVAAGAPAEVLTAQVLERTYGAPLEVLIHAGLPVVVDRPPARPA
jgi:zinc/manganese transport system ATP-binding protein